ncbi:uncharacterized protein RCH25_007115 [Pelodytes ibericus]
MDGDAEKKKSSDVAHTLESEDFFAQLTDEEKECLQYLLETIDSLEDDDENANLDKEDREHFGNSTDTHTERKFEQNLRRLSEGAKVSDLIEPEQPSSSKMKIIKSFSEDCPGFSITVSPETGQRSAGSHPSHLRKFDTIMKSGVNVQELRARFIRQQANPSSEDHTKGPELSGASKEAIPVTRNPMSARQEALQKLGLLQRNPHSSIETQNSHDAPHGTTQSPSVANREIKNNPKGSSDAPIPMVRKSKVLEKTWPP